MATGTATSTPTLLVKATSTALMPPIESSYQPLAAGECDILIGFATDSKIAAQNLVILSDDLPFFPVYNPAPLLCDTGSSTEPCGAVGLY